MASEFVKAFVKGGRGPLREMSTLGKLSLAILTIPYLASIWFMNPMRLALIEAPGLVTYLMLLRTLGYFRARARALSYLALIIVAVSLAAVLLGGVEGLAIGVVKALGISLAVITFIAGFMAAQSSLSLVEVVGLLKAFRLGRLALIYVLSLTNLLKVSQDIDYAYSILRALGKVNPLLLLNTVVVHSLRRSILLASYLEFYGEPEVKGVLALRPVKGDYIALIPALVYVALLALTTKVF